jgi:hypothetical protein
MAPDRETAGGRIGAIKKAANAALTYFSVYALAAYMRAPDFVGHVNAEGCGDGC